jgi:hypothetical protein
MNGNVIAITTIDEMANNFHSKILVSGTYEVEFQQPAGTEFTVPGSRIRRC